MDDFTSLLTTALGIVSIATLAGLGLLRGTVTNLREQLKDAREEVADHRQKRADDAAKIARLEGDLDALKRVVTGEAHWEAMSMQTATLIRKVEHLTEVMEEHNEKATEHWTRELPVLNSIVGLLEERHRDH